MALLFWLRITNCMVASEAIAEGKKEKKNRRRGS